MGGRRGRGSWHAVIGWAVGIAGAVVWAAPGSAGLIITEIMYNPREESASEWEWIEVYNDGPTAISLQGWVLDDVTLTPRRPQPNISGGSVSPGGVAVLFNSVIGASAFTAAWGEGINLIPVTNWQGLNNDGSDALMLWQSHSAYVSGSNPDVFLGYGITGNWVAPVDGRSIYYTGATPDVGHWSNWKLSALGVDGAYQSNSYDDVGSPGIVPLPEPAASSGLALVTLAALGRRSRRADRRPSRIPSHRVSLLSPRPGTPADGTR